MYPIALFSTAALAVIIERLVAFSTVKFPGDPVLEEIRLMARENDPDTVKKFIREKGGSFSQVLLAAAGNGSIQEREAAASYAGEAVLFNLQRRLDFLSMIGATAPLMGLLGTVIGMINVFSDIAGAGSAANITLLADGIWQALITTAAGMSVAVPVLIFHGYFTRKAAKTAFWMQQKAAYLISETHEA